MRYILLFSIILFSCEYDKPPVYNPRTKSIPFNCESNIGFIRMTDYNLFEDDYKFSYRPSYFLLNNNFIYAIAKNKILKVSCDNPNQIEEKVFNTNSIWACTALHNYNWCTIQNENELYSKFIVNIIDTLGQIKKTNEINFNARYAVASKTNDNGFVIAFTGNDSSFTAKYYSFNFSKKCKIYRYDSDSKLIWTKEFEHFGFLKKVFQTKTGDIIICGDTYLKEGEGYTSGYVSKLDNLGNILWEKSLPSSISQYSYCSIVDILEVKSNKYLLLANYHNENSDYEVLLTDSAGNIVWKNENKFSNPSIFYSSNEKIILSHDDNVSGNGRDIIVSCYNLDGQIEWEKTFGGSGDEHVVNAIEISNGYFIIGQVKNYKGTAHLVEEGYSKYYVDDFNENNYIIRTDFQGNNCK